MVPVRAATLSDLDTVVTLRLALLHEAHESPVYGRLRTDVVRLARQLYRAQLESPSELTLLAELDGAVIGILRCVEANGHPLLEPDRYAYVSSVYVVPSARRKGVVRALLGRATQWCRDRELDEMRLHSAAASSTANATWDALGFTVVEHLRVCRVPPRPSKRPAAEQATAGVGKPGQRATATPTAARAPGER